MVNFPLFKKTENNNTYYKIASFGYFEEIKRIGKKYLFYTIEATQLPERNYIRDLTENEQGHFISITEEEYEEVKKKCDLHK
ncbi:MAG: hypothetical protein J7604_26545 [Sporocytophaga sp.]|uniref:hypothetical protein n=1 Tax=Sporocytophaga sp. TaxID=2231183 RepID=UPI001B181BE4|nr:hypothetical protein [Sporocytophaga sp.]MBO9703794.1 hypothetical protein [Sporocytophaga sp.]